MLCVCGRGGDRWHLCSRKPMGPTGQAGEGSPGKAAAQRPALVLVVVETEASTGSQGQARGGDRRRIKWNIFSAQSPALGKEPGARQGRSERIDAGSAEQTDVRTPPHLSYALVRTHAPRHWEGGLMVSDVGVRPEPGGGTGGGGNSTSFSRSVKEHSVSN